MVMYLISDLTTSLCTLNNTSAQVIVHSSIFSSLSVTCISLLALNGTKGGQHRQVTLFLVQLLQFFPCL